MASQIIQKEIMEYTVIFYHPTDPANFKRETFAHASTAQQWADMVRQPINGYIVKNVLRRKLRRGV